MKLPPKYVIAGYKRLIFKRGFQDTYNVFAINLPEGWQRTHAREFEYPLDYIGLTLYGLKGRFGSTPKPLTKKKLFAILL
jgi:hypothetical protein